MNDLKKGRALPIGTERTWGGQTYVKAEGGWKPKGKDKSSKRDESEKSRSKKPEDQSKRGKDLKEKKRNEQESKQDGEGRELTKSQKIEQAQEAISSLRERLNSLEVGGRMQEFSHEISGQMQEGLRALTNKDYQTASTKLFDAEYKIKKLDRNLDTPETANLASIITRVNNFLATIPEKKEESGGLRPIPGKTYEISPMGKGEMQTFILESSDGMHAVEMFFSSEDEAKKFAKKKEFPMSDDAKLSKSMTTSSESGDALRKESLEGEMKDICKSCGKIHKSKNSDVCIKCAYDLEKAEEEDLNIHEGHSVAIILKDPRGCILFLKRSKEDDFHPNTWCLPGGGIDGMENPLEAAVRELKEEAGLSVKEGDLWPVLNVDVGGGKIVHYFEMHYNESTHGSIVSLTDGEMENYEWKYEDNWRRSDLILDLKAHLKHIVYTMNTPNVDTVSNETLLKNS